MGGREVEKIWIHLDLLAALASRDTSKYHVKYD